MKIKHLENLLTKIEDCTTIKELQCHTAYVRSTCDLNDNGAIRRAILSQLERKATELQNTPVVWKGRKNARKRH